MSKGTETRQRILEQAAAVFNQHGYEGASMAALMEATGLEKGGIYRHFASKEELALEAFDYAARRAMRARFEEVRNFDNSVDQLKAFVRSFVERYSSLPGGCPLFNTAVDADDGNPQLRKRAKRAIRRWLKVLRLTIRRGIEAREIRREINPEQLAILIFSTLEGALVLSRLEKDREPLRAVQTHLERYLEFEVRFPEKKAP
jgi:TetR/AcrR family transcriptional regulator, transcriptional repressor for nem operon